METKTIRERIAELTAGAKTHTDLDAIVSRGVLRALIAEFPNAGAEIMYEWDSMKTRIRKMA
jgi:hypothetical protein